MNPELKLAIISQSTPILSPYALFTSLFKKIKPTQSEIKSENHFEYTPNNFPSLKVSLKQINSLEHFEEKYKNFDSFLIMVDIQKDSTLKDLDSILDTILEASDFETVKLYIFGFFQGPFGQNKDERITTLIDAKGIDYEYIDLDIRNIEEFAKVMEYVINDSFKIKKEKIKENKHSDVTIAFDQSKSNCILF